MRKTKAEVFFRLSAGFELRPWTLWPNWLEAGHGCEFRFWKYRNALTHSYKQTHTHRHTTQTHTLSMLSISLRVKEKKRLFILFWYFFQITNNIHLFHTLFQYVTMNIRAEIASTDYNIQTWKYILRTRKLFME